MSSWTRGLPPGSARSAECVRLLALAVLLAVLRAGVAAASPPGALAASGPEVAEGRPLPLLVKVHADWCVACLQLDTTWTKLERAVGDEARLVVFDVTNRRTLAEASAEAERLGLAEYFETHRSQTGSIGLVDGATRQPVRVWMAEPDPSVYVLALSALEPAPLPVDVAATGDVGPATPSPPAAGEPPVAPPEPSDPRPLPPAPRVEGAPARHLAAMPVAALPPVSAAGEATSVVPAVELLGISWEPVEAERVAVVAVAGAAEPRRLHQGDVVGPLVLERIERFGVVFRHGDEEIHRVLTRVPGGAR